jgi:hypothetical protein
MCDQLFDCVGEVRALLVAAGLTDADLQGLLNGGAE